MTWREQLESLVSLSKDKRGLAANFNNGVVVVSLEHVDHLTAKGFVIKQQTTNI
jgi:hypothetical protein